MAQSSPQLDIQVLHDLRQRFPEIPEGVVSQCMLQNNNNLEACCRALSQESSKYLYMEYHSPDDNRMNRNRLLHINLGIHSPSSYHPGDGAQLNGGRTLVHSSSDGHIDPQHAAGKQLICLVQEPHSAPAVVAATPNYNPFFMNEQNRSHLSFFRFYSWQSSGDVVVVVAVFFFKTMDEKLLPLVVLVKII
uniref:TGF-beta activated kinase 1 (MAP3K7) binding protein 3 n=1 Tax=Aotus nancymaae TaxID=37293 RepID=A0A2K5BZ80_AOTNA